MTYPHDIIATDPGTGYALALVPDTDCPNPREDCPMIAVIACRDDHRHYTFGDEGDGFDIADVVERAEEAAEESAEETGEAAPPVDPWQACRAYLIDECGAIPETLVGLAVTDHSGLYLHVDVPDGSGGGWDSAFIGWAYATRDSLRAVGHEDPDALDMAEVRQWVIAEAEEYGAWMAGDCWGFEVLDPDGAVVEACYGFIGSEYAEEEGRVVLAGCVAEHHARDARREAEVDAWAALCSAVAR